MEGDRMRNKKFAAFFNRKSYIVAVVIMVVAAFGMMGLYYAQQEREQEEQLAKQQEENVRRAKEEDAAREKAAKEQKEAKAVADAKAKILEQKKAEEAEEAEETAEVSGMIEPQDDNFMDEPEVVAETSAPVVPDIHFNAETDLSWPLQGNVILDYSTGRTIYSETLQQYQSNPAIVIKADVNTPVTAVASGTITSIETDAVTGLTMTVDMGDGYSARHGQLKEIPKGQGDYVDSGEIIGYVSEPTKYYSVEGSNLYFQLWKEGATVDPMQYLEH